MSDFAQLGMSLPIGDRLDPQAIVDLGRMAERAGFGTVLAGEINGAEFFSLAGALAAGTKRIRLGSGVIPIGTRSPALSAMGFATLAGLAPGRLVAGFGLSTAQIVTGWHGRPYSVSRRSVLDYLSEFRRLIGGQRRADGFRLGVQGAGEVQVMLGTVSTGMLRVAGAVADGVILPPWVSAQALPTLSRIVAESSREEGRQPPELIATVWAYCGPERAAALSRLRLYTVTYALTAAYRHLIEPLFSDLTDAESLLTRGRREEAYALASDDLVEKFAVVGTGGAAISRAEQLIRAGAKTVLFALLPLGSGDAEGPARTVRAIAKAGA